MVRLSLLQVDAYAEVVLDGHQIAYYEPYFNVTGLASAGGAGGGVGMQAGVSGNADDPTAAAGLAMIRGDGGAGNGVGRGVGSGGVGLPCTEWIGYSRVALSVYDTHASEFAARGGKDSSMVAALVRSLW